MLKAWPGAGRGWHAIACHDEVWHGMSWHDMTWHAMTCHAMPPHAMPGHAMTCHGMEPNGMPQMTIVASNINLAYNIQYPGYKSHILIQKGITINKYLLSRAL